MDGIDDDVLIPLPMRQHPKGSVLLEEVEQEALSPSGEVRTTLLVNLVTGSLIWQPSPIAPPHPEHLQVRTTLLVNLVTESGRAPKDGAELVVRGRTQLTCLRGRTQLPRPPLVHR